MCSNELFCSEARGAETAQRDVIIASPCLSGTIRTPDCVDFPAQQGKKVLYDILLGLRIESNKGHLDRFFDKYIKDAKDATGKPLYPSLDYVPSGNSFLIR